MQLKKTNTSTEIDRKRIPEVTKESSEVTNNQQKFERVQWDNDQEFLVLSLKIVFIHTNHVVFQIRQKARYFIFRPSVAYNWTFIVSNAFRPKMDPIFRCFVYMQIWDR